MGCSRSISIFVDNPIEFTSVFSKMFNYNVCVFNEFSTKDRLNKRDSVLKIKCLVVNPLVLKLDILQGLTLFPYVGLSKVVFDNA